VKESNSTTAIRNHEENLNETHVDDDKTNSKFLFKQHDVSDKPSENLIHELASIRQSLGLDFVTIKSVFDS
jgi:hypothetical protein